MTALTQESLILEVEEAIGSGSEASRSRMLRRVTDLFIGTADRIEDDVVSLFDDVIGRLADVIEDAVRAELATRLAPIENAPRNNLLLRLIT